MARLRFYDGIIPVRLLAEYLVCPTQAWLRVMGQPVAWNADHWKPGEERDPPEALVRAAARSILGAGEVEVVYRPLLVGERLGLAGAPDAVAVSRMGVDLVVEYKETPPKSREPWLVQAAGYKLVYEDARGRRAEAVLLTPHQAWRVEARHVARALRVLHELRRLLARPDPPPPRGAPPCMSCNYRRLCPYRDTVKSRILGGDRY